jgi:hypothetical protein
MALRLGLRENMVRIFLDPLKVLEKIFNSVLENGFWRRCKNSEIYKLYYEYDNVKFIKLGRLRWAEYVMRTEESDSEKEVLCTKPQGSGERQRGRPKLSWCDKLDEEIAQVGCRNWRINAQSRQVWQKLTEVVTPHPGI